MNTTPRRLNPIFLLLLLAFVSFNVAAQDTSKQSTFRLKTVVIDAGHGGKDPGARGNYSREKDVALLLAKKLKKAIDDSLPDVKTVMTRADDTFIELHRRATIANNNKGNLFVSIHLNSTAEGTAARANKQKGVEMLVYKFSRAGEQLAAIRENESIKYEADKSVYKKLNGNDPAAAIINNLYLQKYRKQSILFGGLLNKEFKDTDGRRSAGVKEQSVHVLANSGMPSVLVEVGFINNPEEEEYLNSAAGQNEVVQSILRAVKAYRKALGY
jgi:N-acetylmuramoyl-L-alanine amidase